jgi:DNA-binding phage protein
VLALRVAASRQVGAAHIAEQNGVSRQQLFHWLNALRIPIKTSPFAPSDNDFGDRR